MALLFYTRLPVPPRVGYSEAMQRHVSRYLPLVGLVVGGGGALVFWGARWLVAAPVAIVLSMIATVWMTGAFHEDGFADVCDGFGGGWTREQVLAIMKDPRLGAFGAVGLGLLLALKFLALNEIELEQIPVTLIAGHSISRFAAVTFLYTDEYVRRDESSKVQSMTQPIALTELGLAGLLGVAPLLFGGDWRFLTALVPVFVARWLLGRQFRRVLGGYTGDCLGAVQQVTEVIFYLWISMALWR